MGHEKHPKSIIWTLLLFVELKEGERKTHGDAVASKLGLFFFFSFFWTWLVELRSSLASSLAQLRHRQKRSPPVVYIYVDL